MMVTDMIAVQIQRCAFKTAHIDCILNTRYAIYDTLLFFKTYMTFRISELAVVGDHCFSLQKLKKTKLSYLKLNYLF